MNTEPLPEAPPEPQPQTADAMPGAADAPPAERVAELEAALVELNDKWLRAEAEAQNIRARTQREVADARAYAAQKFAADVVEVAENLRRGLASLPVAAEDEPELLAKLRGGFEGLERAFWATLERNGVKRHEPAGAPFDPELHQAMQEAPAPEGVAPGTVLQAWSAAWTLNGRLIRPAMVVVAAGEAAQEPKPDAA